MKYILMWAIILSFLVSCGGGDTGTSGGSGNNTGNTDTKTKDSDVPCSTKSNDEFPPQLPGC